MAGSRQAGGEEGVCVGVWVCGGVVVWCVVVAGWWCMVADGKAFGFN